MGDLTNQSRLGFSGREAGAAEGHFRKRVSKDAAMCVMRQIICFVLLNIEACKPVLVDTQTKCMKLEISIICTA